MLKYIEYIFPVAIIIQMVFACIICFSKGKIGSGSYWAFAALLNISIVFLIKRFG